MTAAATAKWSEVTVKVDWSGGTSTYELICGLTARSITREIEITRTEVPDCENEALPLSISKAIKSVDWGFTGSGVYDRALNAQLSNWLASGLPLSVQIEYLDAADPGDVATVTGPAILSNWTDNGEHSDIYKLDMGLEWDGTPVTVLTP